MNRANRNALSHGGFVAAVLLLFSAGGCEQPAVSAKPSPPAKEQSAPVEPATLANAPPASEAEQEATVAEPKTTARVLPRTFDDIKFDIEPDAPFDRSLLTDEIEKLNGKQIEIRGYILPGAQSKLRDFVLVRDNQECCFGPGAALYDCILVSMTPGEIADFSIRPVTVKGKFRIEPFELGGATRAVFRMTADDVE